MNPELIGIGAIVGALIGLTGVGGGSIMTPLLVLVLGVDPLIAVGTDLLYSVPTKLFGAYLHYRQRTINLALVAWLGIGGLPAAVLGIFALYWLRGHADVALVDLWIRRAIGASLFISAVILIVRTFLRREAPSAHALDLRSTAVRLRLLVIGAAVGALVSVTSIGSGSVTVPMLSFALPAAALSELIGSDIAFAALLIPIAAIGHWSMGNVNLPVALNLLAGSLPGVFLGSRLCGALQQRWLRPAVALTLALIATRFV